MSTLLEQTAIAMLRHPDYHEEPKQALIDSYRRMRRERNAAYEERDTAHARAAEALHTAIAIEAKLLAVQEQLKQAKRTPVRLWISTVAALVVAFFSLVRMYAL